MVAITLACEPVYYVRRHHHVLDVNDLVSRADALCDAYRHLWVWWAMGERQLCVVGLEDVGRAPALGACAYDGENWYRGSPPLGAPGERRVAYAADSRLYSSQYAVPRQRLAEVVNGLAARAEELGRGRVVELKFVGAQQQQFGVDPQQTAHGPIVCANVLWRLAPAELDQLDAFQSIMRALNGRAHRGKLH